MRSTAGTDPKKRNELYQEPEACEAGSQYEPVANGESGALAGDDGTEELYDSPRGDWSTESDGGRVMLMLRVTAGAGASTAAAAAVAEGAREDDEEGEKEEYLRSLPRPESGRGPATVSSQSWSRRPITTGTVRDWLNGWLAAPPTCVAGRMRASSPIARRALSG